MKKYVQSFRLFFGSCPMKSLAVFFGVMIGFIAVFAIPMTIGESDFLAGFIKGISSMLALMIPMAGFIFLNSLYTYINPATPGYKHFASVPDIAGHFSRAIVSTNVLFLLIGAVLLAITAVVYSLLGLDCGIIFFGIIVLFVESAVCNFVGYLKSTSARMLATIIALCTFGFISGFSSGASEEEGSLANLIAGHITAAVILTVIAAAVYAASLIYTLKACERKWGQDK